MSSEKYFLELRLLLLVPQRYSGAPLIPYCKLSQFPELGIFLSLIFNQMWLVVLKRDPCGVHGMKLGLTRVELEKRIGNKGRLF